MSFAKSFTAFMACLFLIASVGTISKKSEAQYQQGGQSEGVDWNYWNYWDFESGEWRRLDDIAVKINRTSVEELVNPADSPWTQHYLVVDVSIRALRGTVRLDPIRAFGVTDDLRRERNQRELWTLDHDGRQMYSRVNPGRGAPIFRDGQVCFIDEVSVGASRDASISRRIPFYAGVDQFGFLYPNDPNGPGRVFEPSLRGTIFLHYNRESTQVTNLDWQRHYIPGSETPRNNQGNDENRGSEQNFNLEEKILGEWVFVGYEGSHAEDFESINFSRIIFSGDNFSSEVSYSNGTNSRASGRYAIKGDVLYDYSNGVDSSRVSFNGDNLTLQTINPAGPQGKLTFRRAN